MGDAGSLPLWDYLKAMKPLLLLTGLAVMIGAATPAHADSNDDAFLVSLKAAGVTYQDPGRVIAAGKWICQAVGQGTQMSDVVKTVEAQNPGLSPDNAAKFTAIAANVYCPNTLGH
jgi:hypothetical protein